MLLRFGLSLLVLSTLLLGCEDDAVHAVPEALDTLHQSAGDATTRLPEDTLADPLSEAAPAPDFRLPGLDGDFALADQRGHIVVLNFWATWNELSQTGLAALSQIHAETADDGVMVVGVVEDERPLEAIQAWLETHPVPDFPVLADTSRAVAALFGGIELLPTTVVIDREGLIRAHHTGILSYDELLDLLGPILIEQDEPLTGLPEPTPGIVQILLATEVPNLVADGAMLVDVRLPDDRKALGALPDAQHCPLATLVRDDLPANFAMPVIFVSGDSLDAHEAARRALDWGYVAVYIVEGGVHAWAEAGLPLRPVTPSRREPPPVLPARTVFG